MNMDNHKSIDSDTRDTIIIAIVVVVIIAIVAIAYYVMQASNSKENENSDCKDVTSIDYNWDNDVLCTRVDGSQFYTDYAGGKKYDPDFRRN